MSLNLILGHSARAAISTMQRCRTAHTVCVVSPSPRAERRMSDADLIETFNQMADIMTRMMRMETHFYSSNSLWLPASALTAFLNKAKKLECILLNGVRLKGSKQDIIELGLAIQNHPKLKRTCLFNIDALRNGGVGSDAPMRPVLEGMTRNPNLFDFTLRFAHWANPHMSVICCPEFSQITSLRISGKETMFGPEGDGVGQGFPDMMESLKTNTKLEELIINQCPGPIGTGALFAQMLSENTHLQKLFCHLTHFNECLPITEVMARDNTTLTHLEMYINNPNNRKRNLEVVSDESSGEVEVEEVKVASDACETMLQTNGTLVHVKLSSRLATHTTDQMKLFVRMNVAGRMELLQNDDLSGDEALEFLEKHSDDTSLIWYILRMKESILPTVIETSSVTPVMISELDEDDSDDEPIKFGSTTSSDAVDDDESDDDEEPIRIPATTSPPTRRQPSRRNKITPNKKTPPKKTLRKRNMVMATNLQAARSKTLKKRRKRN